MTDLSDLKRIVEFMREYGVVKYGDITLGPAPAQVQVFDEPAVDKPAESVKSQRGSDGLTAREQLDLYGRVIDAKD
jgi:hypothetical protein